MDKLLAIDEKRAQHTMNRWPPTLADNTAGEIMGMVGMVWWQGKT